VTFKRHKKGKLVEKKYTQTAKCSKKFVEICDEKRSILAMSQNDKNKKQAAGKMHGQRNVAKRNKIM